VVLMPRGDIVTRLSTTRTYPSESSTTGTFVFVLRVRLGRQVYHNPHAGFTVLVTSATKISKAQLLLSPMLAPHMKRFTTTKPSVAMSVW
jgi:hypothetical protein